MATIAQALAQAMRYHQGGDLAEAEKLYRAVLQADPAEANCLHLLGLVAHQKGQHEEALALIRQAVVLLPSAPVFHANLAAVYVALGRWDEAVVSYEQAVRLRPTAPQDRTNLGDALKKVGRLAEAAASFQEALRLQPDNLEALTNLADALKEQGRFAEAEPLWRRVLAVKPDNVPAWEAMADIYLAQWNWAGLEAVAGELAAVAGPAPAAITRARGHLARREFDQARRLLHTVIIQDPKAVRPRLVLAYTWLQENTDAKAAEQALLDVLALDPFEPGAYANLTQLLKRHRLAGNPNVGGPETLKALYQVACTVESEINEHLPTLYELAIQCRHVTEMGTRLGLSTTALLHAQPSILVCYDKVKRQRIELLEALAGCTKFLFHQADVLQVEIETTDLLFIDTWHVYDQLKQELASHPSKARKFIVIHDTTTFGDQGESEGHAGLWPAIDEFLQLGTFRLKQRYTNNNGLTVLERI